MSPKPHGARDFIVAILLVAAAPVAAIFALLAVIL